MMAFGVYLLIGILCGPGFPFALALMWLYEKLFKPKSGHGTSGGTGLLIILSAMLTALITSGGVQFLIMSGYSSLATAWAICYITALIVCGLMLRYG